MPAPAYSTLSSWNGCVDAFAFDLYVPARLVAEDPDTPLQGYPEEGQTGEPSSFGGRFPFFLTYRITTRGTHREAGVVLPGAMEAEVLIVDRATGGSSGRSGRARAESATAEIFGLWINKLAVLGTLDARASSWDVAQTAAGQMDEYTRAMFFSEPAKVTWALSGRVVATV